MTQEEYDAKVEAAAKALNEQSAISLQRPLEAIHADFWRDRAVVALHAAGIVPPEKPKPVWELWAASSTCDRGDPNHFDFLSWTICGRIESFRNGLAIWVRSIVLSERERCAQIVERELVGDAGQTLAAAIRKQE